MSDLQEEKRRAGKGRSGTNFIRSEDGKLPEVNTEELENYSELAAELLAQRHALVKSLLDYF